MPDTKKVQNKVSSKIGGFDGWFEKKAGRSPRTIDKVVAIVLVVIFLFVFYIVLDANKYSMLAHIVEGEGKVGVNPTTESLDFGDLSRGTSAVRRVNIENSTFMPMYIMIFKRGGLSDLIDVDKNFFTLAPDESVKIEFAAYVPASAELGKNYTGKVYLFKIPTFGL